MSKLTPSGGICLPLQSFLSCNVESCRGSNPCYPNSVFFTSVNIKGFGRIPSTALSVDRDFEPLANVKVLSSTLVKLYLAGYLLVRFHCGR